MLKKGICTITIEQSDGSIVHGMAEILSLTYVTPYFAVPVEHRTPFDNIQLQVDLLEVVELKGLPVEEDGNTSTCWVCTWCGSQHEPASLRCTQCGGSKQKE